MEHLDVEEIATLMKVLRQHEEMISQLLGIIAATNRKVEEINVLLNYQEPTRSH